MLKILDFLMKKPLYVILHVNKSVMAIEGFMLQKVLIKCFQALILKNT